MPLSEHVSCVVIAFKMTEWVEQWICIKFWVKLEHSSEETIQMIQKATAMGNWWLAASTWQCAHCLLESFLAKHQITYMTEPLCNPDLGPCDFWLFKKLTSPLKGKRFQIITEIQENTTGQLMAIGRTWWGPKVPALKRTEVSLSCVCVSCVLYLFQ